MDKYKNLKKHLEQQIKVSKQLDSDWVYMLRKEAETILEMLKEKDGEQNEMRIR